MNDLHLSGQSPILIHAEFERKLKEQGFAYQCNTDRQYILGLNNLTVNTLTAKLLLSDPIDITILGSRNNNELAGIGLFRFQFPKEEHENDFLILAFHDTNSQCIKFIIISSEEFKSRLIASNRGMDDGSDVNIVFWLMSDNQLFETTNIGVEAEWYYLSKGVHGRMADDSAWDYSRYLNDWSSLKKV